MSLEDLNDAVYRRDFQPKPGTQPEPVQPVAPEAGPHAHPVQPSVRAWGDTPGAPLTPAEMQFKAERRLNNRKRLALMLVAGLLALLAVLGFFGRRLIIFEPAQVSFELSGPEIVEAGQPVELTFTYSNQNWMGLSDAEVVLYYPDTFRPDTGDGWETALNRATKKVGVIPGGVTDKVKLTGTLQSYDKRTALFRAVLRSSPKGISNPTELESRYTVLLEATPIRLDVSGPLSLILGQPLEYVVRYENESSETLENLRLVATYPVGFVATGFDPRPASGENTWQIGTLAPKAKGQLIIRGEIRGQAGDARRMAVKVGKELGNGELLTLSEGERVTRVQAPPLSVDLTFSARTGMTVQPGEDISAEVNFKNNGDVGIRDLIATIALNETYLDIAKGKLPPGVVYDRSRQAAIVRASEVPDLKSLEPGEAGRIQFSLKVRSDLASLGYSNVEIKTKVTLDSPDLPKGENTAVFMPSSERVLKVSSPTSLDLKGYYQDTEHPNTGPLPPKVGEETTYTLRLSAVSSLNPLNESRMVINLPSTVRLVGIKSANRDTVRYNDRTGELIWTIGTLPRGETDAGKLVFQVGLTPPPGSVGQSLNLVNGGLFSAKDSFTGDKVEVKLESKNISLTEDPSIGSQQDRVAE